MKIYIRKFDDKTTKLRYIFIKSLESILQNLMENGYFTITYHKQLICEYIHNHKILIVGLKTVSWVSGPQNI